MQGLEVGKQQAQVCLKPWSEDLGFMRGSACLLAE
jgi:hypothetical protein